MALLNDDQINTGIWRNLEIYWSFVTTVSQLKISDFSGEILKVLKCYDLL